MTTAFPSSAKIARGAVLVGILAFHAALAQTVVPVGSGSYASFTPAAESTSGSYYALPQNQVAQLYTMLHLDPALASLPIPTNHWWSDLLISNRSYNPGGDGNTQYVLQQDKYGGSMWFIPGMLDPESYGLRIYTPNTWQAPNGAGTNAAIDEGSPLVIKGNIPYGFPPEDILLADFESGYPAGTTITNTVGTAFATPPSSDTGQTGFIGTRMASSRGNNTNQGKIVMSNFTVNKHYLHLLVGGGNTVDTSVRLVINGTAVFTATGVNSTTLQWVTWDLTPYAGQTAHVEIVDQTGIAFGFISCDQIFLSDATGPSSRFGGDLNADKTVVSKWGDWSVDFALPDSNGHRLDVTMARGVPFTWTRWTGMKPRLVLGAATTFYNTGGAAITVSGGQFTATMFAMTVFGKTYGVYLPDNTVCLVGGSGSSTYVEPQLSGANDYMVVGYLPAVSNLAEFGLYAYARPTDTKISWAIDAQNGGVNTTWDVTATPMKGTNVLTIQGWLPHHWRTTTRNFSFLPYTYVTQRGTMKTAVGNSFQIRFPFSGIPPVLPPPVSTGYAANNFVPSRMTTFLTNFKPGNMIGDTYGSGKALTLAGQYLTLADEMGDATNFARIKTALVTALQNWLTYTPGEGNGFFSRYPDWKALIGSDVGYGSQAFNDLHFHYGYFAHAAALLGKYDKTFLANYGPMLREVVKSFANYDRNDLSQPFLRTFDVWEGHGNAGGLSSGGDGVNQESSSEAMNSWVGVYLLGSMLNDSQMTATGAMGFAMEGCAVNEYWQDLYKTNFPAGYTKAGAGVVWGEHYAYGTYFSADPAWIYAIQMLPSAHWMNYMVRDQAATVSQKYQQFWQERVAWSGETSTNPSILGGYPGSYVLAFQALWDHVNTPVMFDNSYNANEDIGTNNTYAGATYYLIHAMRQIGDQDFSYSSNIPTAAVYFNSTTNARKAVIYNPSPTATTATFYRNGVVSFTVPVAGYADVEIPVGTTPTITSDGTASGTVNVAFNYQIAATNSPTSFGVTGTLPAGVTVNTSTGLISGTPTAAGTFNVTISATKNGETGTKPLAITIAAPPPAPVINSPFTAVANTATPFSYQITASGNPTSFNATGLAPGLTVSTSTGLISGTATAAGTFTVSISATNTTGTDTETLTLTITDASSDTNLALNKSAVTASSFQAGNLVANANDSSTTTRWAAVDGTFPQWWRVDLGSSKVLSKSVIQWYVNGTRAYKYKVEVSNDDVSYSPAVDKTSNTTFGTTTDLFAATARYVRVTVTGSTNGGNASAFDIAIFGHDAPPPAAATLDSVASRQTHGGSGNLDMAVPLSGTPCTEARQGSPSGTCKLVLTFSAAVSNLTATLGLQAGQSGSAVGTVSSISCNGTTATITLTGVGNAQRLKLHIAGDATADIPINTLWGDVNADGVVNILDLGQMRLRSGEAISAGNCKFDENADGAINILDMGVTRQYSGTALP
ncbi:MAG: glycosyl hydrolase [Chthoniobacterales bacterium]